MRHDFVSPAQGMALPLPCDLSGTVVPEHDSAPARRRSTRRTAAALQNAEKTSASTGIDTFPSQVLRLGRAEALE